MNQELDLFRGNLWSPIREFNRLFGELAADRHFPMAFAPACDMEETEKAYLLTMDLPGVSKNDVKIELHDRQLVISGEKQTERKSPPPGKEGDRKLKHFVERSYGSFRRAFTFPTDVNADQTEAAFTDGVLKITVPKSGGPQPKQIKLS